MDWGRSASATREYWVRQWQQHIQRQDRSSFDDVGQDIYEYLRNKVIWVVQTKDDTGVAGVEFRDTSHYVRGLVWSLNGKEQLMPCLRTQLGERWRPVILVPTSEELAAVYCPWLAWFGDRPRHAHKSRLRLLEESDDESSTTTDCPISGIDDEWPTDNSDRDIGTDGEWSCLWDLMD